MHNYLTVFDFDENRVGFAMLPDESAITPASTIPVGNIATAAFRSRRP